jgi:hypothetical protein
MNGFSARLETGTDQRAMVLCRVSLLQKKTHAGQQQAQGDKTKHKKRI